MPPPAFGHRTGMSRNRFEEIWDCLQFSYQPDTRPAETPSEEYRWMLVEDFVRQFNQDREQYFTPSSELVADESMSRWYGLGSYWINCGLTMYVEMDRKPENGAEIQTCCCGKSGVMLRMKLVKSEEARRCAETNSEDEGLNDGTQVLKELVYP